MRTSREGRLAVRRLSSVYTLERQSLYRESRGPEFSNFCADFTVVMFNFK